MQITRSIPVEPLDAASEHPEGGGTQATVEPPSTVVWRQKPLQHWSPVSHEFPFCMQGSSAQKPRMLPDGSS